MGVVSIIDSIVEKHPLRKISHGEAVAGLLAYILLMMDERYIKWKNGLMRQQY